MFRPILFTLMGFVFLLPTQAAEAADWTKWHAFWHNAHVDRMRNNSWPQPFQAMDREAVCNTLSIQLANGWRRQNTLAEIYFNRETHALNEAGRRRLFNILSAAPQQYQTIYVVQAMNQEEQDRREESIRVNVEELFAGNIDPQVQSVKLEPRSWSADYIDAINVQRRNTMMPPQLPSFQSTTGN